MRALSFALALTGALGISFAGTDEEAGRLRSDRLLGRGLELLRADPPPGGWKPDVAYPWFEKPGPVGEDVLRRLLRDWHRESRSIESLLALAARERARVLTELLEQARALEPGASDWRPVYERLKADHPSRDGLLDAYREAFRAALEFCRARRLFPLDATAERVEVVGAQSEGRFPFARYQHRILDAGYTGYLVVSVPEVDDSEQLADHHRDWIRVVAAHEAVPGHHLQLAMAHGQGRDRAAGRWASSMAAEGWGLYAETLLAEQGYFDTPQARMGRLKLRLLRVVRVELDILLHTHRLSEDQAARRLVHEVGLSRASAAQEARRYLSTPTQPLSYLAGEQAILEMRAAIVAREGPAFDLAAFHERLLRLGSRPLSLAAVALLDQRVLWR